MDKLIVVFFVLLFIVVIFFSIRLTILLKKDKREYLREEAYSLIPNNNWDFLSSVDKIFSRGFK